MLATTIHESNTTPHHQNLGQQHASHPTQGPGKNGPVVSKPNSVLGSPHTPTRKNRTSGRFLSSSCAPDPSPTTGTRPSHESLESPNPHTMWAGSSLVVLLRKEVIQPHLPVRLPCYDFVPIADPTFDGSLPEGLGHRLRVLPTFMT